MARRKQPEQTGASSTKISRGGAVGALVIIFAAVFICIVAITLLYSVGNGAMDSKDDAAKDTGNQSNEMQIAEQLKGLQYDELEYVPTPDLSDADAFASYLTKTTYYRECSVIRSDGKNQSEQTLQILRDGELYNIRTIENGVLVETLISDGKQACIKNEITGGISICPLGQEFSVENLVGLTDHSELTALVSDYSAGGDRRAQTGLSAMSLSMLRGKGLNMLVINLTRSDTGARETYYYYLDYGYVYHSSITLGAASVHTQNTTVFTVDVSEYKKPDSFTFPEN